MNPNCSKFDDLLAMANVKSEHCIGLMKGCFPWLKSQQSLCCIISFVCIAVILHNALINEPYNDSWKNKNLLELDDDGVQNMALEGNTSGTTRHEQLLHYFLEVSGTRIL